MIATLTHDPALLHAGRIFMIKIDALIVGVAYLIGSIPAGYVIGKTHGIDIRKHGSGNIGATNVWRTLGKKAGTAAFACDTMKGLLAVLVAKWLAGRWHFEISGGEEAYYILLPLPVAAISAAVACILGHNFPVWLKFKGGKGIATSLGVMIGMMPLAAAASLSVWVIVFYSTRYVSLASIAASITVPTSVFVFLMFGMMTGWPYLYFAIVIGVLAVWRHRANIVRLLNGTEPRFEKKKSDEISP